MFDTFNLLSENWDRAYAGPLVQKLSTPQRFAASVNSYREPMLEGTSLLTKVTLVHVAKTNVSMDLSEY
ncbi:hypothetical protein CEXT_401061 [Caerostris extrusa]|uniref:Uncharacterized protein n=1 Tax=Caerostris extrusa TaxID=172846 RepID=A0AAV4UWM4_CAEEX|nr:hypothetical protein CEXT_401061 [Caerostris extrusa]